MFLPNNIWSRKHDIITEVYGFAADGWEARAVTHTEAFHCYSDQVSSLVHGYQRLLGLDDRAEALRAAANQTDGHGFVTPGQPVFAIWFYKVLRDGRCDVLGNSLASLTGLAGLERARVMIAWMETQCAEMRRCGELALDLPPCLLTD